MALGKGGSLMAILGGGKGAPEGDGMGTEASAMRDLKEAFDSGDFEAAAAAFKDAYRACSMGSGGGEEPEGDEYPEE